MSVRVEVRRKVHDLLLAALASSGATAAKVIPAFDAGTKPATPYLTLRVLAATAVSSVEDARAVDGVDFIQTGRQVRDARVAIQAFGEVAVGWLEALDLRLGWPSVMAVAVARQTSPVRDLTAFLDTDNEARAEVEIGLYVDVVDDQSDTLIPAATVGADAFGDTFIIPAE